MTCGSVMLLDVTNNLLYSIKRAHSFMYLKSQDEGGTAG